MEEEAKKESHIDSTQEMTPVVRDTTKVDLLFLSITFSIPFLPPPPWWFGWWREHLISTKTKQTSYVCFD